MVRHLKNLETGNFSQQLPQAAPACDEEYNSALKTQSCIVYVYVLPTPPRCTGLSSSSH
jgi:hypothetical protein